MLGQGKYADDYDAKFGGRKIAKGPALAFAQALLALNKPGQDPVVDIAIYCKDTAETSVPIFRNISAQGLDGTYTEFRFATAGNDLDKRYLDAFETDLLLTRNADDMQMAIDNGVAAAVINVPPAGTEYTHAVGGPVQIWVDGDAVSVGSSSEVINLRKGLGKYFEEEARNFDKAMEPGPFTAFLAKISALNATFAKPDQPFTLTLLTARSRGAVSRLVKAARKLGIDYNGGEHFAGNTAKADVIKAFKPHFFADDGQHHLTDSMLWTLTGLVGYPTGSAMDKQRKEQARKAKEEASAKQAAAPVPPRPRGRH
jgi:5'-nucleotidase